MRRTTCPMLLARWQQRERRLNASARGRRRASACPRPRSPRTGYDLSLNRYKEVVHEEVEHVSPKQILAELNQLEEEIQQGLKDLEAMLT